MKENEKEPGYLYDHLREYARSDYYPLHMPGHKRRLRLLEDPFSIDLTEINGFDDLHHPEGVIREAQERAARFYGADESWLLVNGSTVGILAGIGSCFPSGSSRRRLLAARNSHQSVYHAMAVHRLDSAYLYPVSYEGSRLWDAECAGSLSCSDGMTDICGPVTARDTARALKDHPDIGAVCVTSPTYDGVISDIAGIAREAHRAGAALIVDEAHGAHLGVGHPAFPAGALEAGADIVIQSLHKMMPSLTQTALLHVRGKLADRDAIRRLLDAFQTSSPSYVLMASIDECLRFMKDEGMQRMEMLWREIRRFHDRMKQLRFLTVMWTDDPLKILISGKRCGLSGIEICDILRKAYHMECEMAAPSYALALLAPGDDDQGLVRLGDALLKTDRKLSYPGSTKGPEIMKLPHPEIAFPIWKAWDARTQTVPLRRAVGRISAQFVHAYPPGIPILVPGERITSDSTAQIEMLLEGRYTVRGIENPQRPEVRVLL